MVTSCGLLSGPLRYYCAKTVCTHLLQIIMIRSVYILHCYTYLTGKLIYGYLLSHCTQCKTNKEYDHSQCKLTHFLSLEEMEKFLSMRCVRRISSLQASLLMKEYTLDSYLIMDIRNCMDVCTIFPVESNNNSNKHELFSVHANMNLDRSTQRMIDDFNNHLRRQRNVAQWDMYMTNNVSCAPTKHLFIKQGQGLIDRSHDRLEYHKLAQIGPYCWLAWNFDSYDFTKTDNVLHLHIPTFMRVQELTTLHSVCDLSLTVHAIKESATVFHTVCLTHGRCQHSNG